MTWYRLLWGWRNFRPRWQAWIIGEHSGAEIPLRFVRFRREADGRAWVARSNTGWVFPGTRVELRPLAPSGDGPEDPRVQAAVEVVARRAMGGLLADLPGRWEDYPEVGEGDWAWVVARAVKLVDRPDDEEYRAAYAVLKGRAEAAVRPEP